MPPNYNVLPDAFKINSTKVQKPRRNSCAGTGCRHYTMRLFPLLRPPVCLLCRLVASVADEGRGNTHSLTHTHTGQLLAAHARRGLINIATGQMTSMLDRHVHVSHT